MARMKKYDIFISYRRNGGEYTAKILRDNLKAMGYRVFFDVEALRNGPFNTKLYDAIDASKDFILVLSPDALDRCVNEDDWVRREIEYAILHKKNIIPVMLRGFTFPDVLPDTIEDLRMCNGIEANSEFFEAFLQKLQKFLVSRQPLIYRPSFRKFIPACLLGMVLVASLVGGYVGGKSSVKENTPPPETQGAVVQNIPAETEAPAFTEPAESLLTIKGRWNDGKITYTSTGERTALVVLEDNLLPNGYLNSETPGERYPSWNFMLKFDSGVDCMLNVTLSGEAGSDELFIFNAYMEKNTITDCYGAAIWKRDGNKLIFDIELPNSIPFATYEVCALYLNLGTETEDFVDHYEFWAE